MTKTIAMAMKIKIKTKTQLEIDIEIELDAELQTSPEHDPLACTSILTGLWPQPWSYSTLPHRLGFVERALPFVVCRTEFHAFFQIQGLDMTRVSCLIKGCMIYDLCLKVFDTRAVWLIIYVLTNEGLNFKFDDSCF